MKCVIFITPSLFILKVVCCSTFSDWCKSLGDVISSMSMLCFCAEPEVLSFIAMFSVTIICSYSHMKFITLVLKAVGSALLSHMGLYSFYHTPYTYTHIRHNLCRLYILSNIVTILYITGSILVYYLEPHPLQKFPS